jgi:hypothetical protein
LSFLTSKTVFTTKQSFFQHRIFNLNQTAKKSPKNGERNEKKRSQLWRIVQQLRFEKVKRRENFAKNHTWGIISWWKLYAKEKRRRVIKETVFENPFQHTSLKHLPSTNYRLICARCIFRKKQLSLFLIACEFVSYSECCFNKFSTIIKKVCKT